MTMNSSRAAGVFLMVCASFATVRVALSQDANSVGFAQSFGISSSLRANDNFGLDDPSLGTTTLWDNVLDYELLKETSLDQLSLGLGGTLRFSDIPQQSSETEFDAPFANFSYIRNGANSLLDTRLRYSEIDLAFEDPFRRLEEDFDDLVNDELVLDDGTRKTATAGLEFETGLNDPIGAGLVFDYRDISYEDTTDPNLFDRRTSFGEVFGRFRFSPVLEGRLSYGQEDYRAPDDNDTARTSRFTDFTLTYDISPVTLLEATIGYTDINETSDTLPDIDERGLTGDIDLMRELPNGFVGVNLSSERSINGRRNSLVFNRELELPFGGLAANLGVTRGPLGETNPIGSVVFTREGPRTTLTGRYERVYTTNDRSQETRTTRAQLGYEVAINTLSFVTFNFDYASVTAIGRGSFRDSETGTFRTAYIRELTDDWDFSAGYEYVTFESNIDSRRDSNEIFLTLSRRFTTRR